MNLDDAESISEYLAAIAQPWTLREELPEAELHGHAGYAPLQVQLLANRGLRAPDTVAEWMAADWHGTEDELPNLGAALARIHHATSSGEKVAVYGDFDADGITSCALMVLALRAIGCQAEPIIPPREEEGRSLSSTAVKALADRGVSLIITTDGGTTNSEAVEQAATLGVDVVVTDHHAPHGPVARAVAVVNPMLRAEPGPAHSLAGVGVAFRVAEALLGASRPDVLASLLDLVAIGTLADIMPLTMGNWALARAGLARINSSPRPGIAALLRVSRILPGMVDEGDVNFRIAPRINAGGRMGQSELPLRLLLAEDHTEADALAKRLDALNVERQQVTDEIMRAMRVQTEAHSDGPAIAPIFAEGAGWPLGVLGLVAGKVMEESGVPTICVSRAGSLARGSIRAPDGYDVISALGRRAKLFRHFGGHPRAAGFSCAVEDLEEVRSYLLSALVRTDGAPVRSEREPLQVDCRLPLSRATLDTYGRMRSLAPYGPAFPPPLFVCRGARINSCWPSGADQRSLRLLVHDGGGERSVIWHGKGSLAARMSRELADLPKLDIVYSLDAWHADGSHEPRLVARVVTMTISTVP